MLKPIEGLPDDVVGIEVVGKVEAEDYTNVLDPAVARAIEAHGRVRLLYLMGQAYDGFSAGAMWQDAKVGVEARTAWERIAVVSDRHALIDGIKLFAWMVPGEVRTYSVAELEDAKAWLSET